MLETLINVGVYLPKYTTGMFVLITNIVANVGETEINMQLKDEFQTLHECEAAINRFENTTELAYILQGNEDLKFIMKCEEKGTDV
jgi:hypothetical protein|tara:strand:+ start:1199 stop:1456 length:258 start_codon:yes stop_codon:yes gene_type:complete